MKIVLDASIFNLELSYKSVGLYAKLSSMAYDKKYCYPSLEYLADAMSCTDRTVRNILAELVDAGLVKIYRPSLRGNNNYLVIPYDLREKYRKDIESLQEFDKIVAELDDYYIGKPADKKQSNSLQAKIKRYEEKVNAGKDNFSSSDLCIVFMKAVEEYRGEKAFISWKTDPKTLKELLLDQGLSGAEAVAFIKAYVKYYDKYFRKSDQYAHPMVRWLKVEWIFSKVLKLASAEMNEVKKEEYADRTF